MKKFNLFRFGKLFLLFFGTLCFALAAQAQVTFGSSVPANDGALVDLKENANQGANSSKGLGLPRVALTKIKSLKPCVEKTLTPEEEEGYSGLMVYNITEEPAENLCEGLYVWVTDKWTTLSKACSRNVDPDLINSPNCYVTKPGGEVELIPIGKAFLIWEKYQYGEIPEGIKISTDLLWQDSKGLIEKVEIADPSVQDGAKEIKVTLKPGSTEGNALVALRMGTNGNISDPIYWSWHIWVTSYDPEATPAEHNNGEKEYIFMTENLGASYDTPNKPPTLMLDPRIMGMQYQWGRKDPFTSATSFRSDMPRKLYDIADNELTEVNELAASSPVGTGIQHKLITGNNNLKNSILNPMDYYYGEFKNEAGSMVPIDWYTADETGATSNDKLWNDESGNKTEFDPCPKGWRVPAFSATKSPWAGGYDDGGTGWGGANPNVDFTSFVGEAVWLIFSDFSQGIGMFVFGKPRLERAYKQPGNVGGLPAYQVGGSFADWQLTESHANYWTATADSSKPTARATTAEHSVVTTSFESGSISRARGASVRCVRE